MVNYNNIEGQAMPVDTTTGSRSSSLASLFSQGTLNDVQMPDDVQTNMESAPNDAHKISRSQSPSSLFGHFGDFGAISLSSPRDSGYATSNDIYETWPVEGSTAPHANGLINSNTASPDRQYNGDDDTNDEATDDEDSSHEDSSDEEGKEYEPVNNRLEAEYRLIQAERFREHFASYEVPESRRRAIGNTLRRAARDEYLQNVLCAYFYQYPEDIQYDAALERKRDAATAREAGYVDFMMPGCEDAEEELITEEKQQELFGGWNWPQRKCKAEFPVKRGPKRENLWVRAEPPRGSTWESLREEQLRKLEEYRAQQQQREPEAELSPMELSPKRFRESQPEPASMSSPLKRFRL
jgi:hypothetical protein